MKKKQKKLINANVIIISKLPRIRIFLLEIHTENTTYQQFNQRKGWNRTIQMSRKINIVAAACDHSVWVKIKLQVHSAISRKLKKKKKMK